MRTVNRAVRALLLAGAFTAFITAVLGGFSSAAATSPAGGAAAPAASPAQAVAAAVAVRSRVLPVNVLRGARVAVTGTVLPARARRAVFVQRLLHRRRWVTLARAVTDARGRYRLRVAAPGLGTHRLRVLVPGDAATAPAAGRVHVVNVYRLAGASWYGPGGSLACGGTLTGATLGVANRTLPCGSRVTLHLGGRTVRVPVVDRGPYVSGRDYDLTPATKRALGFGDVGTIWATA